MYVRCQFPPANVAACCQERSDKPPIGRGTIIRARCVFMHNSRQKSAASALNNLENKVGLLRLIGLFKVNG